MGVVLTLSACTSAPTATSTTTSTPSTSAAASSTTSAPAEPCASATTATLDAALKANKQISSALVIDSKGLHDVKCATPWAVAGFSNDIDGGSVLFEYTNGAWVAKDGGTDVCGDLPSATAQQICG